MGYRSSLVAIGLLVTSLPGCGWFGIGTPPKSASDPAPNGPGTEAEPGEDAGDPEPETPALPPEEAMAPPDDLHDVRPVFGTDTSTEMPAYLKGVKAGMKAPELESFFPGIGKAATPGAVELELAKIGEKWVSQFDAKEPYKEQLSVSFLDDGGLWRIDYTFDPAVVSDEFWVYAQKAGMVRWGKPRGGLGDAKETMASYMTKALRTVTLHRRDDEVTLEVDLRPCDSSGPC